MGWIEFIFRISPIGAEAVKHIYQDFMTLEIRNSDTAANILSAYVRAYRRIYLVIDLLQFETFQNHILSFL